MDVVRTPEERFASLPDFPFAPGYAHTVDGLRVGFIDEGPKEGPVALLLHGEPSWSFLYRKMIPVFVDAGFRVVAPDLIGFGRSDKPTAQTDYTYAATDHDRPRAPADAGHAMRRYPLVSRLNCWRS